MTAETTEPGVGRRHDWQDRRFLERTVHGIDTRLTRVEERQKGDEERRDMFERAMEEVHRQMYSKIDDVHSSVVHGLHQLDTRFQAHVDQEDEDRKTLIKNQRDTIKSMRAVAWTVGLAIAGFVANVVAHKWGLL